MNARELLLPAVLRLRACRALPLFYSFVDAPCTRILSVNGLDATCRCVLTCSTLTRACRACLSPFFALHACNTCGLLVRLPTPHPTPPLPTVVGRVGGGWWWW